MFYLEHIKDVARKVGFDLCGVTECRRLEDDAHFLRQWIAEGNATSLAYLARNEEVRADASRLVEGARSVIVCAAAYRRQRYADDCCTKIASYACTADYHSVMRDMLHALCRAAGLADGQVRYRVFTDSAPIFEKRYAVEAGLGWIGRHSLLITPGYGSYVVLGEIVTDAIFDRYDTPLTAGNCGVCRRCVEACPNQAIAERHIDTRRCISCATIEHKSELRTPLHGWIFGCDECQNACPHNHSCGEYANSRLSPLFSPHALDTASWLAMSKADFDAQLRTTPLLRSGLERIKENIVLSELDD